MLQGVGKFGPSPGQNWRIEDIRTIYLNPWKLQVLHTNLEMQLALERDDGDVARVNEIKERGRGFFNNPLNRPNDHSMDIAENMSGNMLGNKDMHFAYNTCQTYAHSWDILLTGDETGLVKLIFVAEERARRERPIFGCRDTVEHWAGGNTIFAPWAMNAKDYTCAVADYIAMNLGNLRAYKDLSNHPETGERRPHPLEGGNGYMYRRMMGRNGLIDAHERFQIREAAQAQEDAQEAAAQEAYEVCPRCGGINTCAPGWCSCLH